MNGNLKSCFGRDYKFHVNAIYPCIFRNDNKRGTVELDMLSKILAELKVRLDEINEGNSETVTDLYSLLNRSFEQIRNYLNGQQNCTEEDAKIYHVCIEVKMAELYNFAVVIDKG